MKAVTLSLVSLFATASILVAQTEPVVAPSPGTPPAAAPSAPPPAVASAPAVASISPLDVAVQDAIRRQQNQIEARNRLEQARAAEQRRDLVSAATLYDAAWLFGSNVSAAFNFSSASSNLPN